MSASKAPKASDKTRICSKLVKELQTLYGKKTPELSSPVLETILFGICLEDGSWEAAESGLAALMKGYFDLNEIRVSSISEVEQTLAPLRDADWKALRIRAVLRYVYESNYEYQFEKLRKLTQEQFVRAIKKIPELSPFVRDFALQQVLGSHLICFDNSTLAAARWLGLVPEKSNSDSASEFLKPGVRKADTVEFSYLLQRLASDPRYAERFAEPLEEELSVFDVFDRLKELKNPSAKPVRRAAKAEAEAQPKVGKASAKKAAAKKPAAKKVTAKKPAVKKAATKKPSTKKPSTKKPAVKKAAAKKPAATKPAVKKAAAKKPSTKKPAAKKAAAKKPAAKKAAAKKPARKR